MHIVAPENSRFLSAGKLSFPSPLLSMGRTVQWRQLCMAGCSSGGFLLKLAPGVCAQGFPLMLAVASVPFLLATGSHGMALLTDTNTWPRLSCVSLISFGSHDMNRVEPSWPPLCSRGDRSSGTIR